MWSHPCFRSSSTWSAGLHAFRRDGQAQRVPQRDDRGRDRRVVGIGGDVPDEGAIDLQRVQREVLEIAERRVAGAEVVDRKVQPHGAQGVQGVGALLLVVHQHRLGELQPQPARIQPRLPEHPSYALGHPPGELAAGQVHDHADGRDAGVAATPGSGCRRGACTHSPMGTISPFSSARGMNSEGSRSPRSGCRQRTSASAAVRRAAGRSPRSAGNEPRTPPAPAPGGARSPA